jgi:hypothetical protein
VPLGFHKLFHQCIKPLAISPTKAAEVRELKLQ